MFPTVKLFSAAVFPSAQDDVVTSPYNSLLAADQLRQHADVVLPMENSVRLDSKRLLPIVLSHVSGCITQALMGICSRHATKNTTPRRARDAKEGVYDRMNNIAAQVLLDVTSSMRFGEVVMQR